MRSAASHADSIVAGARLAPRVDDLGNRKSATPPRSAAAALRVRLLSGAVVYEGPRPQDLAALRLEVARALELARPDELVFCHGAAAAVMTRLDAEQEEPPGAPRELVVVRDPVMGLLQPFLQHSQARLPDLPEAFRACGGHRAFMLAAVTQDGRALQAASAELRADRDVVLAAVKQHGWALQYASAELRADRDVVLAAVRQNGWALRAASTQLRADRALVLAAVAQSVYALSFASAALQADPVILRAAATQSDSVPKYASLSSFELEALRSLSAA